VHNNRIHGAGIGLGLVTMSQLYRGGQSRKIYSMRYVPLARSTRAHTRIYKLSVATVRGSIKELLASNGERKRKFVETVELQIGLKNYDPRGTSVSLWNCQVCCCESLANDCINKSGFLQTPQCSSSTHVALHLC
jgi:hypothetical protein